MRQLQLYIFTLVLCFSFNSKGQTVPTPADAQINPILLLGGTAHIGNGKVIKNAAVTFRNGKIDLVVDATNIRLDMTQFDVYQINGMHIYPGLIAAVTDVGLTEVQAVRATNDFREVGTYNPNVRSIIAYNTDSQVTPTLKSNGVLLAQVLGGYGRIRCTSSIVQLDAWNYEDAIVKEDDGIWINWPYKWRFKGFWEGGGVEENKNRKKQIQGLYQFMDEATAYCNTSNPETVNLKFEAMCDVFNGNKKTFIEADNVKDIISAIEFADNYNIDIVIVGGKDAYLIPDLLVEKNIPVILTEVNDLPASEDDNIYLPFELPKLLDEAGILYGVSVWNDSGNTRNLAYHMGTAVAHGLDKEKAIQAITSNIAKILGIDDKVGSLESGKQATLIVTEGEVLDIKSSNVLLAFIDGRNVNLGNKQKDLYYKFMKKYDLQAEEY